MRRFGAVLALLALVACGAPQEATDPVTEADVAALAKSIAALGPDVDPDEARRAAEIAFSYTRELAIAYEIVDPPLVHNTKVNMGVKPRGLCWHWAEDMENRLDAEGFETLAMERAIANAFNDWLIDHSTAIIVARGDGFEDGIVLDPWRWGGHLFWDETADDTRYDWVGREEVFARKRARLGPNGLLPG
ncbi:MAG: hypothetical protein AAF762_05900 [Pseudomonadota bacterium]